MDRPPIPAEYLSETSKPFPDGTFYVQFGHHITNSYCVHSGTTHGVAIIGSVFSVAWESAEFDDRNKDWKNWLPVVCSKYESKRFYWDIFIKHNAAEWKKWMEAECEKIPS